MLLMFLVEKSKVLEVVIKENHSHSSTSFGFCILNVDVCAPNVIPRILFILSLLRVDRFRKRTY